MRYARIETITPKDLTAIMECSQRTAYRRLKRIKQYYGKTKKGVVTYQELTKYLEIKKL